ncbi:multidrug effflux MFS transporter [Brachybacterium phenoliresistens]|uniref:MFS transporter n=1 Tax=Brachybacterium phenoliresistens TaxID=396014 RepID=Z9JRS0_9MICO|nr:multidrug effflux MFS transporter [Brachybacterium phenoliresistens]EWS80452.1 MFS transporter [Brachybacterium phenoliresistens]
MTSAAAAPPPTRAKAGARLTATLALLAMIGPFTIDTIFPAFGRIGAEFGRDEVALQQLVSAYLASFAVMSIFHGPLSDALGRKRVMLGGLAIYTLAMIASAFAPSLEVLIALRLVQGASAGAATIVSRVVVRDLFSGPQAQRLMASIMMIFSVAPALAPILGGWVLLLGSWRLVFWAIALYAIAVIVLTALLPETLPPGERTPLKVRAILASLLRVGSSGTMLRLAIASAFAFAAQFLYIAGASIFVTGLLGLGEQDFWVLFVPLIIGMMAGAWVTGRVAEIVPRTRLITLALAATVVTCLVNVVLTLIAPAYDGELGAGLLVAVIGPMLIAFTVALMFSPIQLEILDLFPHERGAAASLSTFFSLVLNALLAGAIAPLVMVNLTSTAVASLVFVVVSISLWTWHHRRGARRSG